MSLSVSTSRLSNWTTTRSGIVARSSGAMSMSGAAVTSMPPQWMREVAREAVDPGAELQPALPVARGRAWCRRGAGAAARARPGRRELCRGPARAVAATAHRLRRRRRRIPRRTGRPSRSVPARPGGSGPTPDPGTIRRPSSRSRCDRPVAGPPPRPQPGHAGRRVAGAALVVRRGRHPDRRWRSGAAPTSADRAGRFGRPCPPRILGAGERRGRPGPPAWAGRSRAAPSRPRVRG